MVEIFENLIGGRWACSPGGATFENENPAACGSNLGLFQSSTPEDVVSAISAAAEAFGAWRRTPMSERQRYIAEFLRLLKDAREDLARVVTLENGKTIRESRAEVDSALVEGHYHLNQVAAFAEAGEFDAASAAIAALANVSVSVAENMMVESRAEGVMILAKVSSMSWPTVKAIINMRDDLSGAERSDLVACKVTYERLRPSTAQQVLRFHRMQQMTPSAA